MDRFFNLEYFSSRSRAFFVKLTAIWVFGLTCGAYVSISAAESISSAMRAILCGGLTFGSLFCALILPFLLTYFAVFTSCLSLLIPIVFVKSFLFAFVACGFAVSFDSAGWLVFLLHTLGDCLILPLLWFIWKRALWCPMRKLSSYSCAVLILIVLICSVSIYVIEPFLTGLI